MSEDISVCKLVIRKLLDANSMDSLLETALNDRMARRHAIDGSFDFVASAGTSSTLSMIAPAASSSSASNDMAQLASEHCRLALMKRGRFREGDQSMPVFYNEATALNQLLLRDRSKFKAARKPEDSTKKQSHSLSGLFVAARRELVVEYTVACSLLYTDLESNNYAPPTSGELLHVRFCAVMGRAREVMSGSSSASVTNLLGDSAGPDTAAAGSVLIASKAVDKELSILKRELKLLTLQVAPQLVAGTLGTLGRTTSATRAQPFVSTSASSSSNTNRNIMVGLVLGVSQSTAVLVDQGVVVQVWPNKKMATHHVESLSQLASAPGNGGVINTPLIVTVECLDRIIVASTAIPLHPPASQDAASIEDGGDLVAGAEDAAAVCRSSRVVLKPMSVPPIAFSLMATTCQVHPTSTFVKTSEQRQGKEPSCLDEARIQEGLLCLAGSDGRFYAACSWGVFPFSHHSKAFFANGGGVSSGSGIDVEVKAAFAFHREWFLSVGGYPERKEEPRFEGSLSLKNLLGSSDAAKKFHQQRRGNGDASVGGAGGEASSSHYKEEWSRPLVATSKDAKKFLDMMILPTGGKRLQNIREDYPCLHESLFVDGAADFGATPVSVVDVCVDAIVAQLPSQTAWISITDVMHKCQLSLDHLNFVRVRLCERIHDWEEARRVALVRQGELEAGSEEGSKLSTTAVALATTNHEQVAVARRGVILVVSEIVCRLLRHMYRYALRKLYPTPEDVPDGVPTTMLVSLANVILLEHVFPLSFRGGDVDKVPYPEREMDSDALASLDHYALKYYMEPEGKYFSRGLTSQRLALHSGFDTDSTRAGSVLHAVTIAERFAELLGMEWNGEFLQARGSGQQMQRSLASTAFTTMRSSRYQPAGAVQTLNSPISGATRLIKPWYRDLIGTQLEVPYLHHMMEQLRFLRKRAPHAVPYFTLGLVDFYQRCSTSENNSGDREASAAGDLMSLAEKAASANQSKLMLWVFENEVAKRRLISSTQGMVSRILHASRVTTHHAHLSGSVMTMDAFNQTNGTDTATTPGGANLGAGASATTKFLLKCQKLGLSPMNAGGDVFLKVLAEYSEQALRITRQYQILPHHLSSSHALAERCLVIGIVVRTLKPMFPVLGQAIRAGSAITKTTGGTGGGEQGILVEWARLGNRIGVALATLIDSTMNALTKHHLPKCYLQRGAFGSWLIVSLYDSLLEIKALNTGKQSTDALVVVARARRDFFDTIFGSDSPLTIAAGNEVGHALASEGKLMEALAVFNETRDTAKLKFLQNAQEAEEKIRQLQMRSTFLNKTLPTTGSVAKGGPLMDTVIVCTNNLAYVYHQLAANAMKKEAGKNKKLDMSFSQVVSKRPKKVLPDAAIQLLQQGEHVLGATVSLWAYGSEDPQGTLRNTWQPLATSMRTTGDNATVLTVGAGALMANLYNNLGCLLLTRQAYTGARAAFVSSLQCTAGILPEQHPDRQMATENIKACDKQHLQVARFYLRQFILRWMAKRRVLTLGGVNRAARLIQSVGRGLRARIFFIRLIEKKRKSAIVKKNQKPRPTLAQIHVFQAIGRALAVRRALAKPYQLRKKLHAGRKQRQEKKENEKREKEVQNEEAKKAATKEVAAAEQAVTNGTITPASLRAMNETLAEGKKKKDSRRKKAGIADDLDLTLSTVGSTKSTPKGSKKDHRSPHWRQNQQQSKTDTMKSWASNGSSVKSFVDPLATEASGFSGTGPNTPSNFQAKTPTVEKGNNSRPGGKGMDKNSKKDAVTPTKPSPEAKKKTDLSDVMSNMMPPPTTTASKKADDKAARTQSEGRRSGGAKPGGEEKLEKSSVYDHGLSIVELDEHLVIIQAAGRGLQARAMLARLITLRSNRRRANQKRSVHQRSNHVRSGMRKQVQ